MKISHVLLVLFASAFAGCGDQSTSEIKISGNADTNHPSSDTNSQKVFDINKLVKEYISQCDTSEIRIVDSVLCNSSESRELYGKDIFRYTIDEIKKQPFDFNQDGTEDFVISIIGMNCWNGSGADNYLSDYFFVTSTGKQLVVNTELTKAFKLQFTRAINSKFPSSVDDFKNASQFKNGISFNSANGESLSASFLLSSPKCATAQACISGEFDFNTVTKKLELRNIEKQ